MQSVLLLSMTSLHNTFRTGWICRAHPSRQFPPANLCCGYNAIPISLSLKARLCLPEGKAKENLCKEHIIFYPSCMFHTFVVRSFCSLLLSQEDTERTHMYHEASQDWFHYKTLTPTCPFTWFQHVLFYQHSIQCGQTQLLSSSHPTPGTLSWGHESCWVALGTPLWTQPGTDNVNLQQWASSLALGRPVSGIKGGSAICTWLQHLLRN